MHYCKGGQPHFSHDDGVGSTLSDQLCTRPIFSLISSIFPPDSSPCAQPSVLMEKKPADNSKPKVVFPPYNVAQNNSFLSTFQTYIFSLVWLIYSFSGSFTTGHDNGKHCVMHWFITIIHVPVMILQFRWQIFKTAPYSRNNKALC